MTHLWAIYDSIRDVHLSSRTRKNIRCFSQSLIKKQNRHTKNHLILAHRRHRHQPISRQLINDVNVCRCWSLPNTKLKKKQKNKNIPSKFTQSSNFNLILCKSKACTLHNSLFELVSTPHNKKKEGKKKANTIGHFNCVLQQLLIKQRKKQQR